jgi:hypothetical protein
MTYKRTKKRTLKEGAEDKTLFYSPRLIIKREKGTLNFDFHAPGWWHDTEDPAAAMAIVAGSEYKSEPEIQQIELTSADKNNIVIEDFLYWLSGGNKQWSHGGDNDFNVGWKEVEPELVKRFGAGFLKELKRCNTLGDILEFYLKEKDFFIQEVWEVAEEEGWIDYDEDEDWQQENIRKPKIKKINESKKALIAKKVRETIKKIVREEYKKALRKEDRMSDAVRELILYADNDGRLYKVLMDNYLKNMVAKKKRGVYNRDLAIKLLEYYYQNYVRPAYKREIGEDIKLSPQERKQFAEYYVNALEEEEEFVNAQPKNK